MKTFLFSSIAVISAALISASMAIGGAIVGAIAGVFNGFNAVVRAASIRLMLLVDADRYNYTSCVIEQRGDLTELNILKSISGVKQSALNQRVWTMGHTAALNQLGNALHRQCGWETARIHGYMREVICDIPGLAYYAGDDFESDAEHA